MKKQEAQRKPPQRPAVRAPAATGKKERTKPREFFRQVIDELKKVAWPTRQEVVAYSVVVVVAVIAIGAVIWAMDYVFTKAVLALYGVET